jgi:ketosteroid isomerase-like protein
MWAQLITMKLKPGKDPGPLLERIRAAEQPGSGLLRTLAMRDQADPSRLYTLVVFESEEKARAREQDPRRNEALAAAREQMADIFDGPPEFTDLVVTHEVAEHPNEAAIRSAYDAVARGEMEAMVTMVDDDVVWHESTPGFEGTYKGRGALVEMFGRLFETGVEISDMDVHDVLANDTHAVVLHGGTVTRGDRSLRSQYVDVYHVQDGKATEHWHLPVDPAAERDFFTD